jgi:hypothetical protein
VIDWNAVLDYHGDPAQLHPVDLLVHTFVQDKVDTATLVLKQDLNSLTSENQNP